VRGVPIILITGKMDELASYLDCREVYEIVKHDVVFYKEYDIGHVAYLMAIDMSFFNEEIMSYIKDYYIVGKVNFAL
jgi:hypothetical protein